jgi:hypothetical protein
MIERQSEAGVPRIIASGVVHPVRFNLTSAGPLSSVATHAFGLAALDPILFVDIAPDALEVKSQRT